MRQKVPNFDHVLNNIWVAREDQFRFGEASGTKARVMASLLLGADGVCTAGGRHGTQGVVAARVAAELGIPCHYHCPRGEKTETLQMIEAAGGVLVREKVAHRTVMNARSRESALAKGWMWVPAWMDCTNTVYTVRDAFLEGREFIKDYIEPKRIVVPVGSGMTLCGILHAVNRLGLDILVVGICVGEIPSKIVQKYTTQNQRKPLTYIRSELFYEEHGPSKYHHIPVDPVYSGKCVKFLKPGDLFWNSGSRYA